MEKTNFELTNPQKSIWLIQQFYEDSTINSIAGYLRVHVACDFVKLEEAFNLFVKNNDAFRIRIVQDKNGPKQYIKEYTYQRIPVIKIKEEKELDNLEQEFVKEPFLVLEKKLYNVKFVELPNKEAVILLNLHHLISDAWTMIFCLNEVYKNYIELLNGKKATEFIENPSYTEFISSQKEYKETETFKKDKEFWETKFQNLPDYISFKTENVSSVVSNRKGYIIDGKIMQKVNDLCVKHKLSVYVFFLSLYTIYFRNIFGSNYYTIGNPVLNRSNYRQKHTAGMFVSTEPFVVKVNDEKTFLEHAQEIAKEQLAMYRHLKYPYDEIFEYVKRKHHTNNKLFDIIFSYQNAKINMIDESQPITAKWFQNYNQVESLMVHMKDTENAGELTIYYDYLINVLQPRQIEAMHERILAMLNQIVENIEIPLENLEIISEKEKDFLIKELNNTEKKYKKESNLVKEFEKIVKKYPNRIAVSCKNVSLTYEELNSKANALANKICSSNIKTDIIAFEIARSIEMIIAIWGILKSGHTYMPIDPEYPEERKNIMLNSSRSTYTNYKQGAFKKNFI